jgi:hypothetical protein
VSPFIAAAATSDRLLIAWSTSDTIELVLLSPSRTLVKHTSLHGKAQHVFAGSDGNEFLLGWTDDHALQSIRVGSDGETQGDAFTLGSQNAVDLTFARTPTSVVLAWSDGNPANVFTRGAANFASIAAAPTALASIGYAQQEDLSLKGMTVWSEGEAHTSIQSPSGKIIQAESGHQLRGPVAARGAGSTLLAWRDVDASGKTTIMAKFDDDAPVALGEATGISDVDVVFDGASFIVVWSNGHLYKTRFSISGAKLETTEVESSGDVRSLSATRLRDKVAIVYADGFNVVYDGDNHRVVANTQATDPEIAIDDHDQPFIVWSGSDGGKPCVMEAHRIDDALFATLPLTCGTTLLLSNAVAWNGTEFVVAWTDQDQFDYRNVHYLRVMRNGAPIDDAPVDVSGKYRDTYGPTLLATPAGVTLGYQRIAFEDPLDDVSRVFTRTIERLGSAPRKRAIGR